jgi:hypothetical protein
MRVTITRLSVSMGGHPNEVRVALSRENFLEDVRERSLHSSTLSPEFDLRRRGTTEPSTPPQAEPDLGQPSEPPMRRPTTSTPT